MSKKLYEPGFKLLVSHLNFYYDINTILKPFEEDAYYPNLKKIYINSNNHWRDRLIALIHESGHVLIDHDLEHSKNMKSNLTSYSENVRSKKQFVSLINEEITAWNVGKKLAISLDICFDHHRLDEISTNCIMSYVKKGLKDIYGSTIDVCYIDPKV
tara:strand:+ start:192 stop:662 length:471 start_codon:yes stop_codon:yes gene_type:complete